MFAYKLHLKPIISDAGITTLITEGYACCGNTLSKLANNAAIVFDWAHTSSIQAQHGVEHAEHDSIAEPQPPCHPPDDNDHPEPETQPTID